VDTLERNAFIGHPTPPTDVELSQALGAPKALWDRIIAELSQEFGVPLQEWKCYSRKSGWAMRVMRGKRTIVWLAPCAGSIQVAFIIGDRAIKAARTNGGSAKLLRLLDKGQKYPEGTGVRLNIKNDKDLPLVKELAALKLAN
jgi:Protein of unknown function (DUF3788)